MVADALDLAEQVRRDDDRDSELCSRSPDQQQHLVPAGRIEAVGRLIEQEQPGIVDERLSELDALLHAGRVATDRPIALLVQPDVPEDLGGPLPRRRPRQPGHRREMRHEIRCGHVRRQAVVLRHVADELTNPDPLPRDVEVEERRTTGRCVDQTEEDLEQRALAGAVRSDEPDDPGLEIDREAVQRRDATGIALRQAVDRDEAHRRRVACGMSPSASSRDSECSADGGTTSTFASTGSRGGAWRTRKATSSA